MGIFDTIVFGDDVDLPEFDYEDPDEIWWQTKSIGHPGMRKFKIEDGRLYRNEVEREETDEVMEHTGDGSDGRPIRTTRVVDEEWVDHNQHGAFQFHGTVGGVSSDIGDYEGPEVYYRYEARFLDGELEDIVLLEKEEY